MRKLITLVLAAVMVLSLCVSTYAINNDNVLFNFTASIFAYNPISEPVQKIDSSPSYIAVATATHKQLRIKAEGSNSKTGNFVNCTYNGNLQKVSYVTISTAPEKLPTSHRIRNFIHETGYTWGRLTGSTPEVLGNKITGHWSVDSSGSAPYAN
jgi:hypothetical protein